MIHSLVQRTLPTVLLGLILIGHAFAGTPLILNHQGRLLDAGDTPISGPVNIEFRIYESQTGGVPLWSEMHPAVQVQDGLFTVSLGETVPVPADLLAQSSSVPLDRYLEVVVQGTAISPRLRLSSVPYAVASSRISGDVETRHGELAIVDAGVERAKISAVGSVVYVGTWDSSSDKRNLLYTDSDSSGLVVGDNQGALIRLQGNVGINEPIPDTKLHIGDIDRDGYPDVVVASNGNERSIAIQQGNNPFVVSSGDDTTYMAMKHNPLNRPAFVNFTCEFTDGRSVLKSEFQNGDIPNQDDRVAMITTDSSRAEEVFAANFESDGTAHVATKKYVDASNAVMELSTKGNASHSNNANIAATLNGNVVIGARVHTDNSGTPTNSSSLEVDDAHASSKLTGGKGFYYVVSSASTDVGDGASHVVASDPNHNAIYNGTIWQKVDNTDLLSTVGFDTDEDGTDDVGSQTSAKLSRSILKTFFERPDKPSQSRVINIADSLGASSSVEIDKDGDGNNDGGTSFSAIEPRSILETYFQTGSIPTDQNRIVHTADSTGSVSSTECEGSGSMSRVYSVSVPKGSKLTVSKENSTPFNPSLPYHPATRVVADSDNDSASVTVESFDATTNTANGTIRFTGSDFEGRLDVSHDADGDGNAQRNMRTRINQLEAILKLSADPNDDGIIDNSIESSCTDHVSRFFIQQSDGFVGLGSSSVELSADNGEPSVSISKDGSVIHVMNGDGHTIRNSSNVVVADMDRDGDLYLSNSLRVGTTAGSHHIDVAGGAYCDGTNWVNASDKNSKENFESVNGEELLNKLSELEITQWNYRGNEADKHIGPTAQDFQRTFGVGSDGKSISTIDPSGIALAAIKELYRQFSDEMKKKDAQIEQLQKKLDELQKNMKSK